MTLPPNYQMVLLAALTFMCVWLVIPYSLNTYNTEWLPRWIRPCEGIIDTLYPYYYPANESRAALATVLFLSFVCTVVAIAEPSERALNALFCLHAVILPSYLQHRYYCFHKVNQFTQYSLIERKYTFIVYRKNDVFLLWLYVGLLFIATLLHWLPSNVLYLLTILPSAIALLYVLDEFIVNANDVGWRKCLAEWVPENYYLLFALLGIGLTQAALWQHNVLLLIAWIAVLMAFTVMEFYFRFCSDFAFDQLESWSIDKSRFLLTMSEELALIRRKEERAMCRRDSSWWLLITCREDSTSRYKMELTADLENKQREMMLRDKQLLYLRKFSDPLNAWAERSRTEKSPERMEQLIHDLNPHREDLNRFDIDSLSCYNSLGEEIEREEEKMKFNNMKKISLGLLLFVSSTQLHAQVQTQPLPLRESPLSPWYVGVTAGVPFGISTFSSFGADKTRIGYNFGILTGYHVNRIFSTELSLGYSSLRMESGRCCENLWLGADGLRYWSAVAGESSGRYGDIYSSASLFNAGLHLNVSLLPVFGVDSRFRVDVSPAVYYANSTAKIKDKAEKQTLLKGGSTSHFGAGADLTLGYRMSERIALGIYGGGIWYSGSSLDAMPRMEHPSNYTLHAGVKLTYTFGRKSAAAKRAVSAPVSPRGQSAEPSREPEVAVEVITKQDSIAATTAKVVEVLPTETIPTDTIEFPIVYFKFNALSIDSDETAKVRRIADILQAHPQIRVELRGWSDPSGNREVNRSVSERRAIELRYRLIKWGVAPERITVNGMGADNTATEADKARRVETIKKIK